MARTAGLEPATRWLTVTYSYQLSYVRILTVLRYGQTSSNHPIFKEQSNQQNILYHLRELLFKNNLTYLQLALAAHFGNAPNSQPWKGRDLTSNLMSHQSLNKNHYITYYLQHSKLFLDHWAGFAPSLSGFADPHLSYSAISGTFATWGLAEWRGLEPPGRRFRRTASLARRCIYQFCHHSIWSLDRDSNSDFIFRRDEFYPFELSSVAQLPGIEPRFKD